MMRMAFFLCLLLAPMTGWTQDSNIYGVNDFMGQGDQDAIGINNLTSEQLANLEQWINLWTVKAINQVLGMGCKCNTQDCLKALMGRTTGNNSNGNQQQTQQQINNGQPSNNPVVRDEQVNYSLLTDNLRNGGLLRLSDGSIWQVSPSDQTRAAAWQRMDHVQIQPYGAYGQFSLVNLSRNDQINVTRPGEAIRPGNPFLGDTFRQANTFSVRANSGGATIVLDNGMAYNINLSDQDRARFWAPGTPVMITRKDGLYPWSLENSQTGETIQGDTR